MLKFSPIFGVLSIISATDMLESHSRALKTRIDLVSEKILSHINGPMGWIPGPGKGSQKPPTRGVPPRKTPTENEKKFFSISTTRLAESVEGLNSSLAQSPGKL